MKALIAILLVVASYATHAAGSSCTYYTRSGFYAGSVRTSGAKLTQDQACVAVGNTLGYSLHWTGSGTNFCSGTRPNGSGGTEGWDDAATFGWATTTAACPTDPCQEWLNANEAVAGPKAGQLITRGATTSPSGEMCLSDDGNGNDVTGGGLYDKGCKVEKAGAGIGSPSGHWFGQLRYTGQSCGASAPTMPPDTGANCVTTSAGQVCISKEKSGCGTVNGDRVCLGEIPPGRCVLISGGGAVCESSATTPPAPDDGEESPAAPDLTIDHTPPGGSTTNTYNYYGPTTVNNSTTVVEGSGAGSANGSGSPNGEDGAADAPEEYGSVPQEWEDCASDLDACVQAQLTGKVSSLAEGIPLLAFATGLDDAFSATPECPAVQMTVFETDYDVMAPVCSVVDDNAVIIALVFQIGWAFCGLRILLKAQQ